MLQAETVEAGTLDLIKRLSEDQQLSEFYLVGGTALSLQVGHRKSIDIDLFNEKPFDSDKIADHLRLVHGAQDIETFKNGIFCFIGPVKVDLIAHQYAWLNPPSIEENIRLASLDDIAAMKLNAIVRNGTRLKDFIDIYVLLEHRTLNQMTAAFEQKYQTMNEAVAKNALLYHNDIKVLDEVNWVDRSPRYWYHISDRLEDAVYNPGKVYSFTLDWRSSDEDKATDVFEEYMERYYKRVQDNHGITKEYGYGYEW